MCKSEWFFLAWTFVLRSHSPPGWRREEASHKTSGMGPKARSQVELEVHEVSGEAVETQQPMLDLL